MKRLCSYLLFIFIISCTPNQNNQETKNGNKKFLLNSKIICKIINEAEYYTRVQTDTLVRSNQLREIADSLNVKNNIVYYHLPGFSEKGEEYASLTGDYAVVYDDFNKEKLLQEKSEREKIKAEQLKRAGIKDKDFAEKAFIISQDFVKKELISPKSADFPFNDYRFSNVIENSITIDSYVDAKNAYNVEIRHKYRIKVKLIGSDWSDIRNWQVINLEFY
jgi:hypothetical protein